MDTTSKPRRKATPLGGRGPRRAKKASQRRGIRPFFYISQGNIPSRWAHSFQAMKMAEAFAGLVPGFTLFTQAHWTAPFRPRFDYESWYGLGRPLRIRRLLTQRAPYGHIFEGVRYPRFDERAAAHAAKKGACVYTRSTYAARCCVQHGAQTVVEAHLEVDHPEFEHLLAALESESRLGGGAIPPELAARDRQAGVPEERLLVWPDAVSLESFEGLPPIPELRRELGLPLDRRVALFCGNLYPDRGIEDVLACAETLPNTEFVLVGGWDKDVAVWRARAASLDNVTFTGFARNSLVPRWLVAADVLLMPNSSKLKTASWMSPMKMFEYMAAGKPIVASHHAVLDRVLGHEESCLFTPPDDPAAMADALRRLARDPELCGRLGAQARRSVTPFTWANRARAIVSAFFGRYISC
jgi:glycosyltransferase involved in cell wall biosynthesis